MKYAVALALVAFVAAVSGAAVQDPPIVRDSRIQKIVGGSVTTINNYPFGVALLHNQRGQLSWYPQWCGGSILTQRTILTCAHCFRHTDNSWHQPGWWRARVGSTWASSGGSVLNIDRYIAHPSYNNHDFDLTILRTASNIIYINNAVAPVSIAGANYNLADNQAVWAIGWGAISQGGASSEQLRHVQIWTINQAVCRQRYGNQLSDNMLCSGWLDVGGRDQCQGDSGGPLIHNNVVVGVCSWGYGCANAFYPGVNVRVSRFSAWIVNTSNSLQ